MSVAIVGTSFSVLADHLVASMFQQRKDNIFHHFADNEEENMEDEVEENVCFHFNGK